MLPEVALVALLEIFGFYMDAALTEAWKKLVYVCRDWRNLVLGSPRRLNLRLECDARPVKEKLDMWPLLPIVIRVNGYLTKMTGLDNVFAALEHSDRICELNLGPPRSQSTKVLAEMHWPFPELTFLLFQPDDETVPVVPDSFLGGSAPRLELEQLWFESIPFPGLPKLPLSALRLVHLKLWKIPHSGYFSPEAMVTGLAALTRLETLLIEFDSPRRRKNQHPLPESRVLLPVLTGLQFKGVSHYLEVLVAHIDALSSKSCRYPSSIDRYSTPHNSANSSVAH